MMSRNFVIGLVIAAILQTAALGWMIVNHHRELAAGKEVVLQSLMRDPRDFFRGHYTRLRLAVENLKAEETTFDKDLKRGQGYLTVEAAKPYWRAVALSNKKPDAGIFLKVQIRSIRKPRKKDNVPKELENKIQSVRISTGFTRYYAPKQQALYLEKINRDSKLGIILSVLDNGVGKIKGITIDGELLYDESVF